MKMTASVLFILRHQLHQTRLLYIGTLHSRFLFKSMCSNTKDNEAYKRTLNNGKKEAFSYADDDEGSNYWINMGYSTGEYENEDDKIYTDNQPLYPDHIPTNNFQKALLAVGSSLMALANPRRADMVAVSGETLGYTAIANMHRKMLLDTEGQEILKDKPTINTKTVDLDSLRQLEEGTLGRAYVQFLDKERVTPDSRDAVCFIDDVELAYVMKRYRETHDLLHTLLGMPTNMQGEVAVKWVEAFQTGLPMCFGGALFGPIRFRRKQRSEYLSKYLPWALRVGANSRPLMNLYWEKRWEQNMEELRREMNIEPPPF